MTCTVLCDCGVTSSLSGCHWESERSPILCLAGVLSSPLLNVCTCSTCTVWTRVPVNGPRQPRSNRLCQTAPTWPEPIRYIQIKSYLTECTQNIGKPAVCGHPVACKGGGVPGSFTTISTQNRSRIFVASDLLSKTDRRLPIDP